MKYNRQRYFQSLYKFLLKYLLNKIPLIFFIKRIKINTGMSVVSKSLIILLVVVCFFYFPALAEDDTIYLKLGEEDPLEDGNYQYDHIINFAASKHNLDPALIKSIIKVETDFKPTSISPKGAQGLMQLMPETASFCGISDATNPEDNVLGGSKYLRYLLELFDEELVLAIAAYNAGPEAVKKYCSIPPYSETKLFVNAVLKNYDIYKERMKKAIFSFSDRDGNIFFSNCPDDKRYKKVE